MASEKDRLDRAGDYIMGRMDEEERARAERDLERDPRFREAVIRLAERLRETGGGRQKAESAAETWKSVEATIATLPQMRTAPFLHDKPGDPPARSSALHSLGGWRGALLAACLAAACAVGYVAGRASVVETGAEPEVSAPGPAE